MIPISTGAYLVDKENAYTDPEILTWEGIQADDKYRLTLQVEVETKAE